MSNISKDFVTKNGVLVRGTSIVTGLTSQTNALQVDGGAAINKNIIVGSTATIYGKTRILDTTSATNSSTGALVVDGGAAIQGDLYIGGTLQANNVSGLASSATNISGGTAGQIVYQIDSNLTGFHGPGNVGDILVSSGTGGPLYTSTASIYVDSSVKSQTLYGGSTGTILYQTAVNQTGFLGIGLANSLLTSDGTVPQWDIHPTVGGNFTVLQRIKVHGTATFVDPILQIGGDIGSTEPAIGDVHDRGISFVWTGTDAGLDTLRTGFFGFDHSTKYFTFLTSASITNEVVSAEGGTGVGALDANFARGTTGSILIQSGPNQTTFIAPSTNDGYVLTWVAATSTATWQNAADVVVNKANTATHLENGKLGEIPYQTEPGRTAFIGTGSAFSILQMGTGSTATFVNSSSVYVGYSEYSNNILGGAASYIPYQSNTSTTVFNANFNYNGSLFNVPSASINSTANSISTVSGALVVAGGVGIGKDLYVGGILYGAVDGAITGVISTATNLSAGTAGQIPYQLEPGRTVFHGPGNVGDILVSSGTGGPLYTATASIYVNSSVKTEKLYGGTAGALVYQTATNETGFITVGATNSILTSDGSVPSWNLNPTIGGNLVILGNLTVQGTSTIVDSTVTNVVDPIFTIGGGPGGSPPSVGDQKDRGIAFIWTGTQAGLDTNRVGFFGFDHSTGYFTFITSATIANEIASPDGGTTRGAVDVNLAGGSQGAIPIQSAANRSTWIGPSAADGYVLMWESAGSTATWKSIADTPVNSANTATNLAGGQLGQIPYQLAPGVTQFIGTGTQGSLLQMGAASTATFISSSSIYVGYSVYANNILGGSTNYIPYQSNTNATTFNNSLTFNGATFSAPQIYISSSTSATSTTTGALVVAGGVGIRGDLWVGGKIFLDGADLGTIAGTTGTFLDVVSTGTITAKNISAEVITATNYLHVSTTTNDVASYGRDLSRTREAFGVAGAIHTLGNVAVGGVLYAGMNDAGQIAGQNPHNKTINGVFVANSMLAGGTYDGITTTSTQTVDTFNKNTYSSAKYMVQVSDNGKIHSQEIMLIHNGTDIYMTQYGIITTNGQLGTFSGTITGVNVLLYFTPSTATNMTVNVVRHSIIAGLQAYG